MNAAMTCPQRLEITLEDNAAISEIKKALMMIKGVASVHIVKPKQETLNETTIKAIKDVEAGKTYKASSVDDLINQCLS